VSRRPGCARPLTVDVHFDLSSVQMQQERTNSISNCRSSGTKPSCDVRPAQFRQVSLGERARGKTRKLEMTGFDRNVCRLFVLHPHRGSVHLRHQTRVGGGSPASQ
jgi:hypothetical protein